MVETICIYNMFNLHIIIVYNLLIYYCLNYILYDATMIYIYIYMYTQMIIHKV